jgi:hypothetical protein
MSFPISVEPGVQVRGFSGSSSADLEMILC